MNIRDFKYLAAVDDLAHFEKAVERCFVSQPTLSAQFKKMEETLSTQLFERSNKHGFGYARRTNDCGANACHFTRG